MVALSYRGKSRGMNESVFSEKFTSPALRFLHGVCLTGNIEGSFLKKLNKINTRDPTSINRHSRKKEQKKTEIRAFPNKKIFQEKECKSSY